MRSWSEVVSRVAAVLTASAPIAAGLGACNYALEHCEVPAANTPQRYALVEYRAGAVVGTTPPAEVQETPSYDRNRDRVQTIALKFPDSCRTESAATATGTSTESSGIMGTNCGVWLSELERALTEHHYKVISWSALRQQQDVKSISTYDAAGALGAQVVLVVNSMETNTIKRGGAAGASYRYYQSNERGERLGKLIPDDADREYMRTFAKAHGSAALGAADVIGLSATLDVTAVLATTGESIWFFRHSLSQARDAAAGMRFLFSGVSGKPLEAVPPVGLPVAGKVEVAKTSEDVEQVSVAASPEDAYKAETHALARQVADECIVKFSKVP
jgi:hypothetical protein